MARRSWSIVLSAVLVAEAFMAYSGPAFAEDAKVHLSAADKSARGKDWTTALAEYEAANKEQASAEALEGVANAQFQLGRAAEAYASYEEYLRQWGASIPKAKKAAAEARLKELGDATGLLTVSVAEAGAAVAIDDRPVGVSPLAAPVRVSAGPHRVRVTKDGFAAFDTAPAVSGRGSVTVEAKLEAQTTKGRLVVKEKTGKAIRVVVDGVDVGDAPWAGDVDAGTHDVIGKSLLLSSAPEKVVVERGKTRDVELVASATIASLKITTSDGKGLIYLDGKLVGEGTFSAEIPAGLHVLRVTRDGFDPVEEEIALKDKESVSRSVTLKLISKIETGAIVADTRRLEGIYGGFGLLMTVLPSGMHSSMQKLCEGTKPAELGSCDAGTGGLGGGLNGFIGYHWDPVGVELYAGGHYDETKAKLDWNASNLDPGIGPDPARTEDFATRRVGGFGALRIRLTIQREKFRFSAAAGVGLSYRSLILTRETHAKSDPNLRDLAAPAAQNYLSPVLSFEPAVHYRLSNFTALAAGLSILIENPEAFKQTPTTPADGSRRLGPSGLTTPAYDLATNTQIFVGPFVGMMFGP